MIPVVAPAAGAETLSIPFEVRANPFGIGVLLAARLKTPPKGIPCGSVLDKSTVAEEPEANDNHGEGSQTGGGGGGAGAGAGAGAGGAGAGGAGFSQGVSFKASKDFSLTILIEFTCLSK